MIEDDLQQLFVSKGWTLVLAESCTGGAIASKLTKVAGASHYFLGGVVSYSSIVKERLLFVPKETLAAYGAVSEQTAAAMAQGAAAAIDADFALAVTGIAGPTGGTEQKPIGTVWMAVMQKGMEPHCRQLTLKGNRRAIIEAAVNAALAELLLYAQRE